MDIQKLDQTYIAGTYARFPVTIVKGKGSLVWDENGKEYIDLSTGIAVDIFGVADEQWMAAVTKQLGTLQHISNLYYTEPCAKLAQLLCEKTGMKKVFFGNSGAEANECAIKAARKWSEDKKGKEYSTIITLKNSFHGRTITTLAATGQDVFHHDFLPLTEGFVYAEPNDLADLARLIAENKCAAVMMEVVQGEGGVMPLDEAYVKGAAKLCQENDLLLICDEVQIGNGRSGMLYGYMAYGVQPDIVSTAKGLAGGLPLGATLLGEKVQNVLSAGTHGSTFGGNPVCCAGAINVLERLDEAMLQGVQARSAYIKQELAGAKGVIGVSGLGLMLGIQTEKNAATSSPPAGKRACWSSRPKTSSASSPRSISPWTSWQKPSRSSRNAARDKKYEKPPEREAFRVSRLPLQGSWQPKADGEVVANLQQPLRLGCAEPPPLEGEALDFRIYGFPYEGKALKRKASRVGGFFLYLPEIPMQDGGEVGAGGGGLGIQGAVGAG